ncbi:MAG: hypothetical protein AAB478_05155 [Patescibacteria group bacterium]
MPLFSLEIFDLMMHAIVACITIELATVIYRSRNRILNAYRQISILLLFQDFLVLCLVMGTAYALLSYDSSQMSWSWLNYLGSSGSNVVTAGSNIKYFGIIFCFLFLFALPGLARYEEMVFRLGTRSWKDGIPRSLGFGLAHMLMGVSLGVALPLSIGGVFFTCQYFKGGVERSTQAHFQYNLIAVSLLTINSIVITFS